MSSLKYIPFLLLAVISHSYGQEIITHLGADNTESWDVIENTEDGQLLFALGFTNSTSIEGNEYDAVDRDVILGKFSEDNIELFGQLASAANTSIAFMASDQSSIYMGGNAFSYLVYQGDTLFSSPGINTAFLLKLDNNGKVLKVITIDAASSALMQDGALKDHQLFALLQVNDTISLGEDVFNPLAGQAGIVVKVDSALNYQNASLVDGGGQIAPTHMALHANCIYIAGQFQGKIISGRDSIMTRTADNDGFLLKLANSGDHRFLKHLKGVYEDDVADLTVDSSQVYVSGQFIGAIEFDEIQIITGLSVAGFVGAFDHDGQAQWLKPLFGSDNVTSIEDIYVHREDEIVLSAFMGERIIFQADTIQLDVPPGFVSSAVIRIDQNGVLKDWAVFEGNPIIFIDQICTSEDELILPAAFTGMYQDETSRGSFDVLLLKMLETFSPSINIRPLVCYPNPSSEQIFLKKDFQNALYQIFNQNGRLIKSGIVRDNQILVNDLSPAPYFLKVIDNSGEYWGSKIVIIR